jgi:hypothetical protein
MSCSSSAEVLLPHTEGVEVAAAMIEVYIYVARVIQKNIPDP